MKRVRIGSFVAASRNDSRATDSVTPSNSKRMFPGRTVATQNSGLPLPFPIRVSGGRAVTDLSGKIFIQSFPFLFMLRVNATRAASIWIFVIQARSKVCSAYSPKAIETFREALPARLPRWVFRYFTLFGIKGIRTLYLKIRLLERPLRVSPLSFGQQPLLPYKSNILPRFCHKRCSLQQSRSRSVCGAYAGGFCRHGTIQRAKSRRRPDDRSSGF